MAPPFPLAPCPIPPTDTLFSLRTKKFLKKQQLRDWLRIVSTSRGVYELKFYNVVNDEADEDED